MSTMHGSQGSLISRMGILLVKAVLLALAVALNVPAVAQQAAIVPLPAAALVPPPEPAVRPIISAAVELDLNRNKIDDAIEQDAAAVLAIANAGERARALAEPVRVELVFNQQITQQQIDTFVRLGGSISHIYKAVSYGWNGALPRGLAAQLPALMGPSLVVVVADRPAQLHLKEATQNGRVRPVWVSGFAGGASGFSGNANITIAVIDTGIDDSHTDLTGRQEFWKDYTADNELSPRDIIQHGSHVTGIALGTGAAIGVSPTQVLYTDSGSLSGVPSSSFYPSPIHIPAGSAILNSVATWVGGGTTSLYGAYRANGSTGSYSAIGSPSTGVSPRTLNNSFTASAANHYSAALLSNGSMTFYAVVNTATFSGVGDGFNAIRGVAPSCKWAGAKVFTNAGSGSGTDIEAAVDDMVTQRVAHNIKVANMSIGIIGNPGLYQTLRDKVNTMVSNGIVAVCSAGNDGANTGAPGTRLVDDPGRAAYAITVAASNSINQLTDYTSFGFSSPAWDEDYKPDVMAPGGSEYYNTILSVDSNDADAESVSFADQRANDYYNIMGTSMASPFAAGAAALVIDAMQQSGTTWDFYTSTTAMRVKMLLCATATESNAPREVGSGSNPTLGRAATPKDLYEGYGILNTDAAIEAAMQTYSSGILTATTAGGYFDRRAWARKVSLVSGKATSLTLTVAGTADYDLYLYSGTPDAKGNPVILASSTNASLGANETIQYAATQTQTAYLVIKRVSGSGSWTLNGYTTAVGLASFTAAQYGRLVLLEWRTGWEVDNLGFHVYREENGKRTRLTPDLVAGTALLAGAGTNLTAGAAYAWWDTLPSGGVNVQYWLEDVDLGGKRTLHGPVAPAVSYAPVPTRTQAALLAQLGRVGGETAARTQRLRAELGKATTSRSGLSADALRPLHVSRKLRSAPPESQPAPSQREVQWSLAAGPAVKIQVRREGWHRVSRQEIVAAGLDPRVNPRFLQLYLNGVEQAIAVTGERGGRFGPTDAIEFYGSGQDTPWTDVQAYWLVAGSRPGKRIAVSPSGGKTNGSPQSFPFTVERKDRTVYFAALRNGDASNFFGPIVSTEPVDQLLEVRHLASGPSQKAALEVGLQGVTDGNHQVAIRLNTVLVGTALFGGQENATVAMEVPQSLLREGDNLVTLSAEGGPTDLSLVDVVRLTYEHTYTTDGNTLRFTAQGGQQVVVQGFGAAGARAVDITEPAAPIELATAKSRTTDFSVSVQAPGRGQRTLLAFAPDAVKKPEQITANAPSVWHAKQAGADLVIVAHQALAASVEPLRRMREGQGLSAALVDVEDLYDEFNFGSKSPWAVREFLASAKAQWRRAPRFVLLVGDASVDPRNYLGFGDDDFVPTKLVDTALMETASDDWFADFNDDGLPEMAVGRLPVGTADEATTVVAKILAYEQAAPGDWSKRVLLVSDNNDVFDFQGASAAAGALLPTGMSYDGVFLGWTDLALARSMLREKLNAGQLLVNYVGHGSADVWASEGLLTARDAESLANNPRLPFVVCMTCLNGFFHSPMMDCLAESLQKAGGGGAVAVWASSGLTHPSEQSVIDRQLFRELFGGGSPTLGEATMRAKAATSDPDIRRTWILFGDPTLRLK